MHGQDLWTPAQEHELRTKGTEANSREGGGLLWGAEQTARAEAHSAPRRESDTRGWDSSYEKG